MNNFLGYLFESSICLSLFYLLFRVLMRKETTFGVNRMLLLSVVIVSSLLPLIQLPWPMQTPVTINLIPVYQDGLMQQPSSTSGSTHLTGKPADYLFFILGIIYSAGALSAFWFLIRKIGSVLSLFRQAGIRQKDGYRLLVVDSEIPSFAFGHSVVISREDFDTHGQAILAHEQAHIRLNHFFDLIILEVAGIFHWFNPFFYRLTSDMKEIHEFQADQCTLTSGIDATQYQLLIIQKGVGTKRFALANSFNHCPIKKRIVMMNSLKTSKAWRWKVAAFLPVLAFLLMAFSERAENESLMNKPPEWEQTQPEKPLTGPKTDPVTLEKDAADLKVAARVNSADVNRSKTTVGEVPSTPGAVESQFLIKGTITSKTDQKPLPHVAVLVKGKTIGTLSDQTGRYEIRLENNQEELVFSLSGRQKVTVKADKPVIDVVMEESTAPPFREEVRTAPDNPAGSDLPISIHGLVTDLNGKPLPFAAVIIKGTTIGTITDQNGNYLIKISDEKSVLVFMLHGYEPVTAWVKELREINVKMKPEQKVDEKK